MKPSDIRKGQTYYGRLITAIFPADSDWAGPGLEQAELFDDEVAYQEFSRGMRSRCTVAEFIRWCHRHDG